MLAHSLMHPSHEVEKTYVAEVKGTPDAAALEQLRTGIDLEEGAHRAGGGAGPGKEGRIERASTRAGTARCGHVRGDGTTRWCGCTARPTPD